MEKEATHSPIYLSCIDYLSAHFTGLSNHCLPAPEKKNKGEKTDIVKANPKLNLYIRLRSEVKM